MPKAKDKTKRRRVQEIEVLILIYERLFFSLTSGDYKWTNGYTNLHERTVFLCRMVIVVNLNDPVEGKEDHRIAIWDEH